MVIILKKSQLLVATGDTASQKCDPVSHGQVDRYHYARGYCFFMLFAGSYLHADVATPTQCDLVYPGAAGAIFPDQQFANTLAGIVSGFKVIHKCMLRTSIYNCVRQDLVALTARHELSFAFDDPQWIPELIKR